MTSWREIDFRYDWVYLVLSALKSGFDEVQKRGEEQEWFDGLWQLEHSESIFGVAFITAQTYIVGVVGDINKIRSGSGKSVLNKNKCYEDDPNPLPNGVNRILLINHIANYYKHQDEWNGWKLNNTTRFLATVGINENTEFPCYEVSTILWDEKHAIELEKLLLIISEWREYILSNYK